MDVTVRLNMYAYPGRSDRTVELSGFVSDELNIHDTINPDSIKLAKEVNVMSDKIKNQLGFDENDVLIYTSGSHESSQTIINSVFGKSQCTCSLVPDSEGCACKKNDSKALISDADHGSMETQLVSHGVKFVRITIDDKDSDDDIVNKYANALRSNEIKLLMLNVVCSDTGRIMPLGGILDRISSERIQGDGIHPVVYVDGTHIKYYVEHPMIDALGFSGCKIGAMPGSGVLLMRERLMSKKIFKPLIAGSTAQQGGLRGGTVHVLCVRSLFEAIVPIPGIGERVVVLKNFRKHMMAEIDRMKSITSGISQQFMPINVGNFDNRSLSIRFPGICTKLIARIMCEKGFHVNTGSACSTSKSPEQTENGGLIRFTAGDKVSMDDTKRAAEAFITSIMAYQMSKVKN